MRKIIFNQKKKNLKQLFSHDRDLVLKNFNFLSNNTLVTKILRQNSFLNLNKLKYFKTKLFIYCFLSGRVRGTIPYLYLSRQKFLDLFNINYIPGFFYSS